MARMRLGEILIGAGVLDASALRAALAEQRRWGGPLGRILVDMKLVDEQVLLAALSRQLNIQAVDFDTLTVSQQALGLIPADYAEQHSLIPFNIAGKFLDVAMSDPTNPSVVDELRIRTQLNIRTYLAGPKAIERALARHYGRGIAVPDSDLKHTHVVDLHDESAALAIDLGSTDYRRSPTDHDLDPALREFRALQERVVKLEALLARDEDVLRKILTLLVEKGVVTSDELRQRIS